MELDELEEDSLLDSIEACALNLIEQLVPACAELDDRIHVLFSPEDWPLAARPHWPEFRFQRLAPFSVAVGIEEEFWIILQWMSAQHGNWFLPMLVAKSPTSGEWTHSVQMTHDITLTPEQAELAKLVDQLVNGHLAVVLIHMDKDASLGRQVFPRTLLFPVDWTGDLAKDVENLGRLFAPQPVEKPVK